MKAKLLIKFGFQSYQNIFDLIINQTELTTRFFCNWTVCISGAEIVETTVLFTRYNGPANWMTAKSNCETLGQRLAVLDTMEKRDALQEQGT